MNNCKQWLDDYRIKAHANALFKDILEGEQAKTEAREHEGVAFAIRITKNKHKFYKCDAVVLFSTHHELIEFNARPHYEIGANGRMITTRPGMSFSVNTARQCIEYIHGLIDARLIQINSGEESPELTKKIEAYKMSLGPQTNPTKKELAQMKRELNRLIDAVTGPGLKALFGVSAQTVNAWKSRGRISASAAHEFCQHEEISKRGFTRELLRPDVKFWVQDVREA